MTTTCTCGKPTRDNAYVCETCLDALAKALGNIPWLVEELDVSITRQKGANLNGGPRATTTALPWHEKASDAQRALHATLATWVKVCVESRVTDRGGPTGWPANNPIDMSRWLLWRVDGLAFHGAGLQAVDEITNAVAQGERIVFWRRRDRIYLGPCRVLLEDDSECAGDVYADEGQTYGYCQECGIQHNADERRTEMEADLDDRLFTAAEIARLCTYLGLDVPRESVRKRVLYWHRHKRVTLVGHNADGDPTFRYGDVRLLLSAEFEARRTA